jgi:hypothetical protein
VPLTPSDDRPDVIRSDVDPDYDCVRLGATAPGGEVATPPPGGHEAEGPRLCPDGYVPRRRRSPYQAEGKRIIRDEPPERNPNRPAPPPSGPSG